MPSLIKLYNEFKNSGFVVLAVDIGEKKKTIIKYVEKAKMPFPVLLDTDRRVSRQYGVRAHPSHFLIDRKGKLMGLAKGGRNWAGIENRNLIRFMLKQ